MREIELRKDMQTHKKSVLKKGLESEVKNLHISTNSQSAELHFWNEKEKNQLLKHQEIVLLFLNVTT